MLSILSTGFGYILKLDSLDISSWLNEKSLHFHIPPARSPLKEPAHPVVEFKNSTPRKVSLSIGFQVIPPSKLWEDPEVEVEKIVSVPST